MQELIYTELYMIWKKVNMKVKVKLQYGKT